MAKQSISSSKQSVSSGSSKLRSLSKWQGDFRTNKLEAVFREAFSQLQSEEIKALYDKILKVIERADDSIATAALTAAASSFTFDALASAVAAAGDKTPGKTRNPAKWLPGVTDCNKIRRLAEAGEANKASMLASIAYQAEFFEQPDREKIAEIVQHAMTVDFAKRGRQPSEGK